MNTKNQDTKTVPKTGIRAVSAAMTKAAAKVAKKNKMNLHDARALVEEVVLVVIRTHVAAILCDPKVKACYMEE